MADPMLKRDLRHLMHTRGLDSILDAYVEIFQEMIDDSDDEEQYLEKLVKDLRKTRKHYLARYNP